MFLPPPPKCQGYNCPLPYLALLFLLISLKAYFLITGVEPPGMGAEAPLQDEYMLLATEPSLQSLLFYLFSHISQASHKIAMEPKMTFNF